MDGYAHKLDGVTKAGFGLVRDKDGNPKIDDPSTLHPGIVSMLSPQERRDIGLWDGFIIRDADGIKRAKLTEQTADQLTVEVLDQLSNAGTIYVDGVEMRLKPRFDAPVGETLIINIS